jgi:hypothetical protein
MSWVEANMRDKDAFLAGIDEQFEKLIANAWSRQTPPE